MNVDSVKMFYPTNYSLKSNPNEAIQSKYIFVNLMSAPDKLLMVPFSTKEPEEESDHGMKPMILKLQLYGG